MRKGQRFREPQPEFHTQHLRHPPPEPSAADEIEYISPRKLKPYPRNARQHSKKQIEQLVQSMRRFGFTAPILIDEDNNILAGHARVEAAKLLKLAAVPCRRLLNLSQVLKRAYVLADNKLALNATYDESLPATPSRHLRRGADCPLASTGHASFPSANMTQPASAVP